MRDRAQFAKVQCDLTTTVPVSLFGPKHVTELGYEERELRAELKHLDTVLTAEAPQNISKTLITVSLRNVGHPCAFVGHHFILRDAGHQRVVESPDHDYNRSIHSREHPDTCHRLIGRRLLYNLKAARYYVDCWTSGGGGPGCPL